MLRWTLTLCLLAVSIQAQTYQQRQEDARRAARAAELQQQSRIRTEQTWRMRESYRRMTTESALMREVTTLAGQGAVDPFLSGILRPMPKFSDRDRKLLTIDDADRSLVLKEPGGAGATLVRVYDAEICAADSKRASDKRTCPQGVWWRATAYSFRLNTHLPSFLSDVSVSSGTIRSNGAMSMGILGEIQENWSEASTATPIISKLLAFDPSAGSFQEYRRRQEAVSRGFSVDGIAFGDNAVLRPGGVYLLRNVVFEFEERGNYSFNVEGRRTPKDKPEDVTLLIWAVKKYEDGSWLLASRTLEKRPSPTLKLDLGAN